MLFHINLHFDAGFIGLDIEQRNVLEKDSVLAKALFIRNLSGLCSSFLADSTSYEDVLIEHHAFKRKKDRDIHIHINI